MSLARGKFGIEYDPRRMEPESSGLGWVFVVVALVALVSFAWTMVKHFRSGGEETPPLREPENVLPAPAPAPVLQPRPEEDVAATAATIAVIGPLANPTSGRPPAVRNLLMRLEAAEKNRDVEMAATTIESIRSLPGSPAADIDDPLARRLGSLNMRRLFTLHNGQWVKETTVKRGDTPMRIAAENGSTLASFNRLNGGKVEKVVLGAKVLVMNHPRFNLVIRRRARIADLALNGKFFKRYDLKDVTSAENGSYEMPDSRRHFWNGFGASFRPEDRSELDLLLPKGSMVMVSEF